MDDCSAKNYALCIRDFDCDSDKDYIYHENSKLCYYDYYPQEYAKQCCDSNDGTFGTDKTAQQWLDLVEWTKEIGYSGTDSLVNWIGLDTDFWIGLRYHEHNGSWIWWDGTAFDPTRDFGYWEMVKPPNPPPKNKFCVVADSTETLNGKWRTVL